MSKFKQIIALFVFITPLLATENDASKPWIVMLDWQNQSKTGCISFHRSWYLTHGIVRALKPYTKQIPALRI
jgi:hypothetical protein